MGVSEGAPVAPLARARLPTLRVRPPTPVAAASIAVAVAVPSRSFVKKNVEKQCARGVWVSGNALLNTSSAALMTPLYTSEAQVCGASTSLPGSTTPQNRLQRRWNTQ